MLKPVKRWILVGLLLGGTVALADDVGTNPGSTLNFNQMINEGSMDQDALAGKMKQILDEPEVDATAVPEESTTADHVAMNATKAK